MKKENIVFMLALVCAIFGTIVLIISKKYLYALFLAFTIPVLIKKLREDKDDDIKN